MSLPLVEIRAVRQIPGEPRRRWFTTRDADLTVWMDESGAPVAFQFCFDKGHDEHALDWTSPHGFVLRRVDDGEDWGVGMKGSPVLHGAERFRPAEVLPRFRRVAEGLPAEVRAFVEQAFLEAMRRR